MITCRLWPQRKSGRLVFKWNFPLIAGTIGSQRMRWCRPLARKKAAWIKLKGKKVTLVYHDDTLWQRADPNVAGARCDARFQPATVASDRPRRGTESHVAASTPAPGQIT
jgi:hypothetical protein